MEGLSAIKEIVSFVNEFGLIPLLLVVCIIFYFLNRDNKKSFEKIENSISSLKDSISNVKELSDEEDETIRTTLDNKFNLLMEQISLVGREIDYVSTSYITKEQHYKDIEGWKSEINSLRKETNRMPFQLMELLMKGEKNEPEHS